MGAVDSSGLLSDLWKDCKTGEDKSVTRPCGRQQRESTFALHQHSVRVPIHSSTPLVQQLVCECCCSCACAEEVTATTNSTFLNRDWLIPPFVVMTQLFPANAGTYPQSCCLWTLHLPKTSSADSSTDSATHKPHPDKAAQLSVRLSPPESRHESSKQELPCRSYCG